MVEPEPPDADPVRAERDFYRRLLELGDHVEIEPLLEHALELAVAITGALRVYLELWHRPGERDPAWQMHRSLTEEGVATARAALSTTVILEAMREGKVVQTVSASQDQRFEHSQSVRRQALEAVVCVPLGTSKPFGVLYLQGRSGRGPFSEEAVRQARFLARHVAPYADRLLHRARPGESDPTAPWRRRLRAEAVVGRSDALAEVLRLIALAAPLDFTVSFSGATGTGKTLFAQVLHASSPRASGPFVEVNCGALPENLIESELFGAEKGAHSTAHSRIAGKVEAAGAGTLFLDEVGELPLAAQAKLLQLLQSKRYFPLGSTVEQTARCRIVVASNRDLREMVKAGRFREDLFYRLDVFAIPIPALADRRADVVPLAQAFLLAASEAMNLGALTLGAVAESILESREWNGNIRELRHAVERAAVLAAGEGVTRIDPRHLGVGDTIDPERAPTFQEATRAFQRGLLERTLAEVDGNVSEAARRLGLARSYVYELIATFGLR